MAGKALASEEKAADKRQDAFKQKVDIQGRATQLLGAAYGDELRAETSRHATDTQAKVQRESINKPGEVERKLAEYERRLGRKLTAEEYKQEIADISAASFGVRHTGQNKGHEHQKMIEDVVNDLQNVKLLRFELANRGTTPERREEINRLIDEERRKVSARFPQGQGPSGASAQPPASTPMPKPGQVIQGYRFKGGDPANPASWEKE
jgi:hypothetical protein